MNVRLFSPILFFFILLLIAKLGFIFERIGEHTSISNEVADSSVFIGNAYASSHEPAEDKKVDEQTEQEKKIEEAKRKKLEEMNSDLNNMPNLTRTEVDLLKDLTKRREKIEQDQKNLTVKEQVLKATENKIDKKMQELKVLQENVTKLLKEYDVKEEVKITRLVKIYETMKPKDAAKIFNELEMPVLIQVINNMKEVKIAPIIAAMNPEKARDISIELARQKSPE